MVINCTNFAALPAKGANSDFYVPTEIISTMEYETTAEQLTSWSINAESFEVNQAIESSIFTLSHDIATTIDDYDRNTERYIREGLIRTGVRSQQRPLVGQRSQHMMFFSVLVLACSVALIWFYRRNADGRKS
jgi:hypothetical protein